MSDLSMRVVSIYGVAVVPAFDAVNRNLHTVHLPGSVLSRHLVSMDSFWECLTNCPNLHDLSLRLDTSRECETPIHTVEHSHLKTCTLYFSGDVDPGPHLDKLRLPVLSNLSIFMIRWSQRDHWPHLAELLSRSRSLTALHISGLHISDDNFLQCLRSALHLVTLVVGQTSTTEAIFKALVVKRRRECLCPRLEQIDLGPCEEVSWQPVRDMILSRWGGVLAEDDDRSKRGPGQVLQRISWCTNSSEFRQNMRGDSAFQQCLRDGLKAEAKPVRGTS
ncbi:hypothetical protein BD410DRAFT_787133 [Rickenella mellea]|uniref:F-box domain-containing protein n=1 Tax=Rickenella mellea TaxID=50990 RepID=A0A4Y7Q9E7_9AGAM|nr:hypothetical protein BD410DRAFT_787133 [Rickenella mellea]